MCTEARGQTSYALVPVSGERERARTLRCQSELNVAGALKLSGQTIEKIRGHLQCTGARRPLEFGVSQ